MTKAQFVALHDILRQIRDALVPPEPSEEPSECVHPEELRISLGTFAHPDHWICRRCKYEHVE